MLKHLAPAALLYFIDAWVMGQGIWATVPSVIVAIVVFVRPTSPDDPRASRTKRSKLLAWLAVPVATIGTLVAFASIARGRAETVVHAVDAFRTDQGRYPAQLKELVPTYLPRIPSASPRLVFDRFEYFGAPPVEHPFLMWVVLPPFGRRTYDFDEKKWSSID